MDRKKCKCGTYYSELINKSGLIVPVFGAIAMFAVLFYVRFVGMFKTLNDQSTVGYWLLIVCSLIGILLIVAYIASQIKKSELGKQDTLLLTFDFLMVFLLLGIIIFDFVSLETVYYAVALVAAVVLTVLRIKFAQPACSEKYREHLPANITVRKYCEVVIAKYGFWKMFIVAFALLGVLYLSDIWNFTSEFLSSVPYMVGFGLVAAITLIVFVFSALRRISSREINTVDASVMFMLFSVILAVIPMATDFSILKLVLWLVALFIVFTLIGIFALNTYVGDEVTDNAFFATDGNKKFAKGPKVYFKSFYKAFNLFALCGISLVVFAIFNALVATNFLSWANSNGFMVYTVVAIIVFAILGIAYLKKNLKSRKVGAYDGLLAVLDVSLLLLTITIFIDFGSSKIVALILWAIALIICIAFSITRLFMVKEALPEEVEQEVSEEISETSASDEEAKKN